MRTVRLQVIVGAIVLLTVVAAFAVASFSRIAPTPAPKLNWTADDLAAAVVHPGDRVVATGFVRVNARGTVLCRPAPVAAPEVSDPDPTVSCGGINAALSGFDVGTIPDWLTYGDTRSSPTEITVEGMWNGSAIEVDTVQVPARIDLIDAGLPCAEPAGGWPAKASSSTDLDTAVERIRAYLRAHQVFDSGPASPTWPSGVDAPNDVQVVWTTGDPGVLRDSLERIYPYGICAIHEDYGYPDLESAAEHLNSYVAPLGDAEIVFQLNRVRVRCITLTDALADRLSQFPQAVPDPLVAKL